MKEKSDPLVTPQLHFAVDKLYRTPARQSPFAWFSLRYPFGWPGPLSPEASITSAVKSTPDGKEGCAGEYVHVLEDVNIVKYEPERPEWLVHEGEAT